MAWKDLKIFDYQSTLQFYHCWIPIEEQSPGLHKNLVRESSLWDASLSAHATGETPSLSFSGVCLVCSEFHPSRIYRVSYCSLWKASTIIAGGRTEITGLFHPRILSCCSLYDSFTSIVLNVITLSIASWSDKNCLLLINRDLIALTRMSVTQSSIPSIHMWSCVVVCCNVDCRAETLLIVLLN